jgi:hypothetical protein
MQWLECRLVKGHGVASGLGSLNPYPAGTIELQRPYFTVLPWGSIQPRWAVLMGFG